MAGEFVLSYADSDNAAVYTALVRLSEGSVPIEFEVQMLEVPLVDNKGREVVAKWTFDGIDNEGVFYTDSNALEMQKRVRDFRPDFTVETDMKVSDNYYPINSAIAIVDETKQVQVTVMNSHSQGGSSVQDGSIELMQNRRLLADDNKGVDEPLNETQADGRGIAVNAKYYLTITDLTKDRSVQRKTQLLTDEPIQVFYAANFSESSADNDSTRKTCGHEDISKMLAAFPGTLKVLEFAEARNSMLIRLENLDDLFDGSPAETPTFDLEAYGQALFRAANNEAEGEVSIVITERTLGNNQDFATMQASKFKWTSADGVNPRLAQPAPADPSPTVVALQPQRIRLFRLDFTPQPAE